jgi:hypothetical protein
MGVQEHDRLPVGMRLRPCAHGTSVNQRLGEHPRVAVDVGGGRGA